MGFRRALLAAIVSTGVAAAPAAADGPSWEACPPARGLDPRQQCASLTVPRDYAEPGGPTIEIAVSRIATATPALRRGVLLRNPGGPGSQGLIGPSRLAAALPREVLDRYDLIGFDPRGIGRSAPASCALAPADLDPVKFIPYPAHDLDIAANAAYARRAASGCAATSGTLLPHISTANTARDMDRIRAALGESSISYVGYSYGSYLGAVYTTLFPHRSDRFVLDSNIHPGRIWRETFSSWGYSVELAFDGFARFAAERHATYGLGATPSAVHAKVLELAREMEREPFDLGGGFTLDGNRFRELIRNDVLRNDRSFPAAGDLLKLFDAREPRAVAGARAAQLLDAVGAAFPTVPGDNEFAGAWAVVCGDADWPSSPAVYQRDVRAYDALFPIHGRAAANIWPCAFWPSEPREPAVSVGSLSSGRALLVQSVRDPATPLDGAVALRLRLGSRSRLVTVEDGAHSVAFNGINSCANAHAATFLASGALPAHDAWCARDTPLGAAGADAQRVSQHDDELGLLPRG